MGVLFQIALISLDNRGMSCRNCCAEFQERPAVQLSVAILKLLKYRIVTLSYFMPAHLCSVALAQSRDALDCLQIYAPLFAYQLIRIDFHQTQLQVQQRTWSTALICVQLVLCDFLLTLHPILTFSNWWSSMISIGLVTCKVAYLSTSSGFPFSIVMRLR
jgi:hypothetical protein